jgi:hypothetical protein
MDEITTGSSKERKKGLTLFRMTSYAEMRSVATKSNVFSSISKISRTLPEAIFLMLYLLRSTSVIAVVEDMLYDVVCIWWIFFLFIRVAVLRWVVVVVERRLEVSL